MLGAACATVAHIGATGAWGCGAMARLDANPSFGLWLRRRRRALDLTQEALAQRVGCAAVTIRKIETDERRPSRQVAERLAEALDLGPGERAGFVRASRAEFSSERLPSPDHARPSGADPRQSAAPLSGDAAPSNNLPAPLTRLFGRQAEIARVRALLLEAPAARLVTLSGPPGVGKTRLALRVAADVASEFPHGVTFVPLAPIADPRLVAPTIAQALGVKEWPGRSSLEGLRAALSDRRLLLVLDNFEQVESAAPLLGELLLAASLLQVLVTSRVSLRIYGEYEYLVPPLAVPAEGEPEPRVAPLEGTPTESDSAAVALFLDRAVAARADFHPGPADLVAVRRI